MHRVGSAPRSCEVETPHPARLALSAGTLQRRVRRLGERGAGPVGRSRDGVHARRGASSSTFVVAHARHSASLIVATPGTLSTCAVSCWNHAREGVPALHRKNAPSDITTVATAFTVSDSTRSRLTTAFMGITSVRRPGSAPGVSGRYVMAKTSASGLPVSFPKPRGVGKKRMEAQSAARSPGTAGLARLEAGAEVAAASEASATPPPPPAADARLRWGAGVLIADLEKRLVDRGWLDFDEMAALVSWRDVRARLMRGALREFWRANGCLGASGAALRRVLRVFVLMRPIPEIATACVDWLFVQEQLRGLRGTELSELVKTMRTCVETSAIATTPDEFADELMHEIALACGQWLLGTGA